MNKLYIILISLLFILSSCNKKPYQPNLSASTEQKQSTTTIRQEASTIEETFPEAKPHTDVIKKETVIIDKASDKLEKTVITLQSENKELQTKEKQWYTRFVYALILAGGLTTAISVALFLAGYLKTFIISIIGVAILATGIVLQALTAWFLYIAIGLVVIFGGLIWFVVSRQKKTAIQLVQTVQESKTTGAVIGSSFAVTASEIQDKSTQNFVKRVKTKLQKTKEKERKLANGQ